MKKSGDKSLKDKPSILITGLNGFVGSHLAELLVASGYNVSGIALTRDRINLSRIESQISIYSGDIRDKKAVEKILLEAKPDYLYHLAGSAFVPEADANPESVYEVNVLGTLNLLEAIRSLGLTPRTLLVGSAEVYGHVPEAHLPVKEDYPLKPISPYGVTKACADLLGYQYATAYQMDVIRVRPFNHIGPRQSEHFVCSSFAKQIVQIEKGICEGVLYVGDLETRRDFTDVRDIARGYQVILENAKGGEVYNIGSNKAWRIGDLLEILIDESTVKGIKLQQQQVRVRPNDIPIMLCDASKLEKAFNWKPAIQIKQTLRDLLSYWRETTGPG